MFKMKAKFKEGSSIVALGLMFRKKEDGITRTLVASERDRSSIIFMDDHGSRWTADYLDARFQASGNDWNKFEFLGFKQKEDE